MRKIKSHTVRRQFTQIGRWRHRIQPNAVANEFLELATDDEAVARLLFSQSKYRSSVYSSIQAMEKYVRHGIFTRVNPTLEYFQERTRTHSLDELLAFLVEIASSDEHVQHQIREQLNEHVLEGIRFGYTHNNARYPSYSRKYGSYSVLEISKEDAALALDILDRVKRFLDDVQGVGH